MASFLRKSVTRVSVCADRADRAGTVLGSVVVTIFFLSTASAPAFGQGGPEACCLPGGNCIMDLPGVCLQSGGTPQGPGSSCTTHPCTPACVPTPNGDRCEPVNCLNPDQQCAPTQVTCGPTGLCQVTACDCLSVGGCHIDLDPPVTPFCAPGQCPDGSACQHRVTPLPTQETLHECVCPAGCQKLAPAGDDCWSTPCGSTKYDFAQTPIPAGFFGPGSDPFTDIVQLGGATGFIDTVITRHGDMCFDGPLPVTQQVAVEIVQLDLISCQPITVTFNGGQNPQLWNLKVSLDGTPQPPGSLVATKNDPNGGTYDVSLQIRPQFLFDSPFGSHLFQPGMVMPLSSAGLPWVQNPPDFGSVCGSGGFFPGVSPADPACCVESCHAGPAPGHDHCVFPPKCPHCLTGGTSCDTADQVQVNTTTTVTNHGGWFEFVAATAATSIETCGSSFDTILEVYKADCVTLLTTNDDCSDGPFGGGSDPNASCFQSPDTGERDSCLCLPTDPGVLYKVRVKAFPDTPPPAGSTIVLTVTKKNTCGSGCMKGAPAGEDCWSTACGSTQYDFSQTPIPADFFAPGSDPFTGVVQLGGTSGFIDTVIARLGDMCFDGPLPVTQQVPIELVQLDLTSCQPILVTFNGGQNPTPWNVRVTPDGQQPQGSMTVIKRVPNGGTFDSVLPVKPQFKFTAGPASLLFQPGQVQDLTVFGTPWVQDPPPFGGICGNGGFFPGVSPDDPNCCVESCHDGPAPGHQHCVIQPKCPQCPPTPANPCDECGPGPHWIHNPSCPAGGVGEDLVPSGATLGIDTDFDCIADTSLVLHGPVVIRKRGPLDDSAQFPGISPVDGHRDVIDTEIISMSLTGGGVTLTAGAGHGAQPLRPTLGAIVEQPPDPNLADSFFDVFVELDNGAGLVAYNHDPLRVESKIDCLPPDTTYIHVSGCTPIFDSPLPGAIQVGNLVTARHFTYPDCCFGQDCVTTTPPEVCVAQGGTLVPDCLGDNNGNGADDACEPECGPTPNGDRCEPVVCPDATQECTSTKVVCMPGAPCRVVNCACGDPERCHIELSPDGTAPVCVGVCPPGEICDRVDTDTNGDNIPDTFECVCSPGVSQPCEECGPGPHWIHNPPCPVGGVGQDVLPSGATIGIDTDFDCIADTSLQMHGPVTIRKHGPLDDSNHFPGSATIDGHLDVVDTEIVAMNLTGGGVTLTAGAGLGAQPLLPSLGTVVEQPTDPLLANSFFDMFVEVNDGAGFVAYNQTPLRVETKVECLPPDGDYIHTSGCTPLYNSPIPGTGVQVGNLVTARHFTYPACCLATACVPDLPPDVCEAQGGTLVPDCLGDNNGNGVDDACEPECGPTPNGDRCEDVTCPIAGDRCLPTKVICGSDNVCRVLECQCHSPNLCHVDLDPPATPFCTGGCPSGMTCVEQVQILPTGETLHECFCELPAEACCLPGATCTDVPRAECINMGGQPLGPNTQCLPPEPCCIVGDISAVCIDTDPRCCEAAGGVPQGPVAACSVPQACCLPSGVCVDVDPLCCNELGGVPQPAGTHCDNGCPPPPHIVHADGQPGETQPCSGYIDPKVDSNDGVNVNLGLQSITLVFNEPVFALGGGPVTPASFIVTETGGAAPPVVATVDASANPLIVLEFNRHITVQEWTTTQAVVQNAAGIQIDNLGNLGNANEPDRHDVGYMPCDVDQNGACGPFDLLKFRQYVNQIATPPCGVLLDYVDINRNNGSDPFDLLVFRQMVNGVSPPTTQTWSGVTMNNPRP